MPKVNYNAKLIKSIMESNLTEVQNCLANKADPNYVIEPYTIPQRLYNIGKTILTGTGSHLWTMFFGSSEGKTKIKGDTVLHLATRLLKDDNDSLAIVKALVDAGANKDTQNDQYEKPFHIIPKNFSNTNAQKELAPDHYTFTAVFTNLFK